MALTKVKLSPNIFWRLKKLEVLFDIIPIYGSFDKYASERVRLQNAGILIPDFDLLIGTTAVMNNLTMVTNNEKHLSRISNIAIENWTKKKFNEHIK
jgi:tRNA(fMet)-specific endonuclease VapC